MAKAKEEKVMFPSLMSMLGIGGSTKGLVGDLTKTSGMGVIPSLKQMGKKDVAMEPDSSIMRYVTEKGFFLDGQGNAYSQTGGRFSNKVEYDLDVHGLPVPLANNKGSRKGLSIASFLRPSGSGALTNREFLDALKIINSTSPNEFIRNQRENILIQQSRFGV